MTGRITSVLAALRDEARHVTIPQVLGVILAAGATGMLVALVLGAAARGRALEITAGLLSFAAVTAGLWLCVRRPGP